MRTKRKKTEEINWDVQVHDEEYIKRRGFLLPPRKYIPESEERQTHHSRGWFKILIFGHTRVCKSEESHRRTATRARKNFVQIFIVDIPSILGTKLGVAGVDGWTIYTTCLRRCGDGVNLYIHKYSNEYLYLINRTTLTTMTTALLLHSYSTPPCEEFYKTCAVY